MTAVLAWLRGLLAVGLLGGFYALAFVLIAVDAVFVVLVLWAAFDNPKQGSNWTLAVGGSIPAVFALIYGVATVSRPEEQPIGAVPVLRREAPGLWRLVEDLADELRTRPPTQIFLTPDVNAAVSEEARMLGLAVGARTMYIGVPLLTQLTPAQLRAVLCHEFGHYAGGHTRFGAVTYRGAMALNSTLFRLRMTARVGQGVTSYAAIFHAIINVYAKVYLRLSLAVRRRQELEADARAAAVAGPAVTAEALRAVHALGHAWAGFLDMFMRPVQRLGFVPEDLFEAFTAMVSDPLVQERLADLREHPTEVKRSPMDSHPPLARRLASIEARPDSEPTTVDDGPLLDSRAPILRVQKKILAQTKIRATALPWATWADLAAEAFAIELASLLLDAARGAEGTARPTLGTVLDALAHGQQRELARRLTDAPEPAEQLAEALYALVGQALAGAGRARWVFSWTKGYLLVPTQETGQDLEVLVAAAARGGSTVDKLRADLLRRGLNVEAPIPLVLRTVSAPAGRTTGVDGSGELPGFVAEEVERQRTVRKFTLAVLVVLGGLWGIALIRSADSNPSPDAGTRVPYDPAGPYANPVAPYQVTPYPYPWQLDPSASGIPYVPPSLGGLLLPSYDLSSLMPYELVTVKRGDTLTEIACRYRTTIKELQDINDMGKRTALNEGELLLVPRPGPLKPTCD
ncbi:M48 family metalloprotease [Actinomycetes bacterium KLBMP 9797]